MEEICVPISTTDEISLLQQPSQLPSTTISHAPRIVTIACCRVCESDLLPQSSWSPDRRRRPSPPARGVAPRRRHPPHHHVSSARHSPANLSQQHHSLRRRPSIGSKCIDGWQHGGTSTRTAPISSGRTTSALSKTSLSRPTRSSRASLCSARACGMRSSAG